MFNNEFIKNATRNSDNKSQYNIKNYPKIKAKRSNKQEPHINLKFSTNVTYTKSKETIKYLNIN